jgi:hypothetical protein
MNVALLVNHPRTRRPLSPLRVLRAQVNLLTVSPLRAARDGVRAFRMMAELLLRGQVPMPR